MFANIYSPEAIAAFITGIFALLSAGITAWVAYYVTKSVFSRKTAQRTVVKLLDEVEFLQAVEVVHTEKPHLTKRAARALVNEEKDLWSTGKFSPAALKKKRESYLAQLDE